MMTRTIHNLQTWHSQIVQLGRIPLITFYILLVTMTTGCFATNYFPLPEQIDDNIDFWIKIFTQYTTDEVIVHDSEHPTLVYEVIHLSDSFGKDTPFYTKWRQAGYIMDSYIRILYRLANMPKPINFDELSNAEKNVFILWADVDDDQKYLRAAQNIRRQRGLRDQFLLGIQRSGVYMEQVIKIFKSYDLPLELCYLPHVESSFNTNAYSKVGAAGMWQFTRHTGRLFLTINSSVDERLDPIKATDAAARLLKSNYEQLGSWPLAITAYNHGVNGMKRAKNLFGTSDFGVIVDNYQSRSFGFASKNFYAEFIAACHVVENSEKYFGRIEVWEALRFSSVELPTYMMIRDAAEQFDVPRHVLIQYNSALLPAVAENRRPIPRGYTLRLPYPSVTKGKVASLRKRDSSVVKVSRHHFGVQSVSAFPHDQIMGSSFKIDVPRSRGKMRLDSLFVDQMKRHDVQGSFFKNIEGN